MQVAVLRVPIVCPSCEKEWLTELPVADIAQALASGAAIRLFARCHNTAWTASALEREQLREYFEATSSQLASFCRVQVPTTARRY